MTTMQSYLVVGSNCINKTATFVNQKVIVVPFGVTFTKKPQVQLSMNDSSAAPAYKSVTTFTDVTIKTQTNWTGTIDVQITERE